MRGSTWARALESFAGASNPRCRSSCLLTDMPASIERRKSTPSTPEPTRGDPIGLAGRRLDHSAKVSISCKEHPRIMHRRELQLFLLCVRRAEISGFQREFRGAHTTLKTPNETCRDIRQRLGVTGGIQSANLVIALKCADQSDGGDKTNDNSKESRSKDTEVSMRMHNTEMKRLAQLRSTTFWCTNLELRRHDVSEWLNWALRAGVRIPVPSKFDNKASHIGKERCISRESNPGHIDGNDVFCL